MQRVMWMKANHFTAITALQWNMYLWLYFCIMSTEIVDSGTLNSIYKVIAEKGNSGVPFFPLIS